MNSVLVMEQSSSLKIYRKMIFFTGKLKDFTQIIKAPFFQLFMSDSEFLLCLMQQKEVGNDVTTFSNLIFITTQKPALL